MIRDYLRLSMKSLRHRSLRSWLTVLGIVVGVAAVVALIAIGSDAEDPARITCHDWHGAGVPWNQGAVRNGPYANGFWAIDVERDGTYEFTLRHQPTAAKFPLGAATARLMIGEVDQTQAVEEGATGVTFTAKLEAGKTRMQTWLTDANGKSRGAFFVCVRRLP